MKKRQTQTPTGIKPERNDDDGGGGGGGAQSANIRVAANTDQSLIKRFGVRTAPVVHRSPLCVRGRTYD